MQIYPTLPGLTFPVLRMAEFDTLVQSAANKYEVRIPQTVNPVWHWELIYDFLRDFLAGVFTVTELRTLLDFFLYQGGQAGEFLYLDPDDNYVGPAIASGSPNLAAQLALVTDGAGHYYSPLQRSLGGLFFEDITDLVAVPAGYANASGTIAMIASAPLSTWGWGLLWSGFQILSLAALPADAVIQGIYPVLIASATHDRAAQSAWYGTGLNPAGVDETVAGASSFEIPAATFASTEFYGASIGASLSDLAGQQISARLFATLSQSGMADAINVTGVGYAIYYATASPPAGSPQMPPPFAMPAGQAVAWALPSAVAQVIASETPGDVNGSATGLAALPVFGPPVAVYANGAPQIQGTNYTVQGPGLAVAGSSYMGLYIEWIGQPTPPITAQFNFYFRVRFESDSQDIEKFANRFWTIGGSESNNGSGYIKLCTARPNPL